MDLRLQNLEEITVRVRRCLNISCKLRKTLFTSLLYFHFNSCIGFPEQPPHGRKLLQGLNENRALSLAEDAEILSRLLCKKRKSSFWSSRSSNIFIVYNLAYHSIKCSVATGNTLIDHCVRCMFSINFKSQDFASLPLFYIILVQCRTNSSFKYIFRFILGECRTFHIWASFYLFSQPHSVSWLQIRWISMKLITICTILDTNEWAWALCRKQRAMNPVIRGSRRVESPGCMIPDFSVSSLKSVLVPTKKNCCGNMMNYFWNPFRFYILVRRAQNDGKAHEKYIGSCIGQ